MMGVLHVAASLALQHAAAPLFVQLRALNRPLTMSLDDDDDEGSAIFRPYTPGEEDDVV